MQFAWKDANVVLFKSTVSNGRVQVNRWRRRPATTATDAAQTRKVFGDQAIKELSIPEFIDMYNHFMGGVDQADQLRSYYNTQRVHNKSWKPLWHFLLNISLVNCYKLSSQSSPGHWPTRSAHKAFRLELIESLFNYLVRLAKQKKPPATMGDKDIHKVLAEEHGRGPVLLFRNHRGCAACIAAGKKSSNTKHPRKPLTELSINTIKKPRDSKDWKKPKRPPRTRNGCPLCKIPLCTKGTCWQEHLDQIP